MPKIPPPAAKMRSAVLAAAKVGAACRAVCPELNTGIAAMGLSGKSGASTAFADAITLSSASQNLFASPLT